MNEGHRPSFQEEEVQHMGKRTKPGRHTYHADQVPERRHLATTQNDEEEMSHEQNSFEETEPQGQGQGQ